MSALFYDSYTTRVLLLHHSNTRILLVTIANYTILPDTPSPLPRIQTPSVLHPDQLLYYTTTLNSYTTGLLLDYYSYTSLILLSYYAYYSITTLIYYSYYSYTTRILYYSCTTLILL